MKAVSLKRSLAAPNVSSVTGERPTSNPGRFDPAKSTEVMTQTATERMSVVARPLLAFCGEEAARALEFLVPNQIPQPYRSLLVHESDMTGTLERYCGQAMVLHIIERVTTPDTVVRHVELRGAEDGHAAEFGAIEIRLDPFEATAREEILEGAIPLGTILKKAEMDFISRPIAYFRIQPGAAVRHSFGVPDGGWLYGRCNRLAALRGQPIADVVEILPPDLTV